VASAQSSEAYNLQTAGYTQLAGPPNTAAIMTSAGTYEMINKPYGPMGTNPDCLSMKGGKRRSSRKNSSRKSRKSLKSSKRSRKN
jgi:hypothetical protein